MGGPSYAVWWSGEDGRRHAGRLDLGRLHVLLTGNGNGSLTVPLQEIEAVEYARGQIAMHVEGGSTLRIGTLDAPGALHECAVELASRLERRRPAADTCGDARNEQPAPA